MSCTKHARHAQNRPEATQKMHYSQSLTPWPETKSRPDFPRGPHESGSVQPFRCDQPCEDWSGDVVFAGRNISTGKTIAWQAEKSTPTASCIKLLILVALMSEVEKGRESLDRIITVNTSDLVGGSGVLRHLSCGVTMSLRDVATLMIILSHNSATNIVIDLIGLDTISHVISEIGLTATRLINRVDFGRIGNDPTKFAVSTAYDFLTTMTAMAEGRLISAQASQAAFCSAVRRGAVPSR